MDSVHSFFCEPGEGPVYGSTVDHPTTGDRGAARKLGGGDSQPLVAVQNKCRESKSGAEAGGGGVDVSSVTAWPRQLAGFGCRMGMWVMCVRLHSGKQGCCQGGVQECREERR